MEWMAIEMSWSAQTNPRGSGWHVKDDDQNRIIADVYERLADIDPVEAERRAKLFAASPEMLHALQCAMSVASLWCPTDQGSNGDTEEHAALHGMRILFQDAIAKATGCGVKK